MAGNKTTVKKTDTKEVQSSLEMEKMMEMMTSFQTQLTELSEMNQNLKEQLEASKKSNEELQNQLDEVKTQSKETVVTLEPVELIGEPVTPDYLMTDNNRVIRVYHMQEMIGGMATVINLTNTKRRLQRMGELITLKVNDFEELVGKYRSFFERGILAVDASDIDYAQMYDLPIYDTRMKKSYNATVLKQVVKYNYEQLQEFYKNLSENNKRAFLSFWLGKVYNKEEGYYDEEKMRWLNNFSNTETFSAILFEIEQNRTRQRTTTMEVR